MSNDEHMFPEHLPAPMDHKRYQELPPEYRIKPICGLVYPGPDPLGVGLGLCVVNAGLIHDTHRDRHGRTWTTEFQGRPRRVTIDALDYGGRAPSDSDHRPHRRRR